MLFFTEAKPSTSGSVDDTPPSARLLGVVWRRHTPVLSTAEVAGVMLVVAMAAQWGHLALRPLLAWQSVGRSAPTAEPARQ